jgi:hypothetical protein
MKLVGQVSNQLSEDSTDIYVFSFIEYCKAIKKHHTNTKSIYIWGKTFYSRVLPESVLDIKIERINDKLLHKLCNKKKYIFITEVIPLLNENNNFYVGIIPFKVTESKKGFNFENQGGINFNYSFNKDTGKFTFINSKGGIPVMK